MQGTGPMIVRGATDEVVVVLLTEAAVAVKRAVVATTGDGIQHLLPLQRYHHHLRRDAGAAGHARGLRRQLRHRATRSTRRLKIKSKKNGRNV